MHNNLAICTLSKVPVAIVVNCVDRLQRSYKDTPALDEMRKAGKIEVHFLKEKLVLTKDSTGMEIMFWNMSVLMANAYVLSMVDNVKRSQRYNRSQGKFQNFAPVGYMNCQDDNKKATIKIDPERGPLVKKLFEEYAKGTETLGSLAKMAEEMDLKSRQSKSGKTLCKQHIKEVLSMSIANYFPIWDKLTPDQQDRILRRYGIQFLTCGHGGIHPTGLIPT